MNFKEKLLSSFLILEDQVALNSPAHKIRTEAIKYFESQGFPTKKQEEWKYTSLASWIDKDFSIFPQKINEGIEFKDVKQYFLHNIDSYRIVFIDGIYSSHLSLTSHDGHDICIMSAALQQNRYQALIEKYYNQSTQITDHLTCLNTAFAREGAYIHIPKETTLSMPIQIIHLSTGQEDRPLFLQPRNLIILEERAQAQIVERHQNISGNVVMSNSVSEIFVNEEATLDYYKIQNDNQISSLIDNTYVNQQSNSNTNLHTFSFGGQLTRNNLTFTQNGSHIYSTLKGITILEDRQHVDHHTLVHHRHPNNESHQDYKGIFSESSNGIFNGKIIVDKIAQKTNAFQQNNNLLIGDKATVNAKPQLEIFADDVKCSHGCTIGQLNKEALFYFRSRGIPEREARALLMYAFGNDVLTSIEIPELKQRIKKLIADKLSVNIGFEL